MRIILNSINMEIIPFRKIFKFLKQLEDDFKVDDISNINPPRSTDLIALNNSNINYLYEWTDIDIKEYLINKWWISNDLKILNKGKIFLKKYSWCFWFLELCAKDYPFVFWSLIFWMFWGFIWNWIIELIKFLKST